MRPARPPARRATPSASSSTDSQPSTSGTSRACRTPTPNASNATYSSAVNTGAMYIGFHASAVHAPKSALLRALWTQAPFVVPDDADGGFHGGSAAGKTARRTAASAQDREQPRAQTTGGHP